MERLYGVVRELETMFPGRTRPRTAIWWGASERRWRSTTMALTCSRPQRRGETPGKDGKSVEIKATQGNRAEPGRSN